MTQIEQAKSGKITDQMRQVAEKETVDAELVRQETAAGRLVIPANTVHLRGRLEPIGIGRALTTKINANIGASPLDS
ncbi:MAG: phosphomethylpyrimidine synthase ThiC, partial [Sedimentisphaerales bacterium]|nr:phosphomethylpyrimidine synthase ThiC [Sedimentisphaerales bacterium]